MRIKISALHKNNLYIVTSNPTVVCYYSKYYITTMTSTSSYSKLVTTSN